MSPEGLSRLVQEAAPLVLADRLDVHAAGLCEPAYRKLFGHLLHLDSVPWYGS